jgi:hypothetical protein
MIVKGDVGVVIGVLTLNQVLDEIGGYPTGALV